MKDNPIMETSGSLDYQAIVEQATSPFLFLKPNPPDYTIIGVNQAYLDTTMTTRGEIIDRRIFEIFPDNPIEQRVSSLQNIQASLDKVVRDRNTDTMMVQKYDIRRPNGEWEERWWSTINSPVFAPDGTMVCITHHVIDVTRLKKIEESRSQLAMFIEQADEAIFSKSLDGTILTWNQGAQNVFGYTDREVIGKPVSILITPDRINEETDILKKVRAGEVVRNFETVRMRKDGTLITVSLTVSPVKNVQGTSIGATTIAHDITDRKQTEETLRFERERMQIILDNMNSGVILFDKKGTLLLFNRTVLEWYGYSRESEISKHSSDYITEFELRDADDSIIPYEKWPASRAFSGEYVNNFEAKLIKKRTGDSRWISFTTVPIPGSHGIILHILMSLVDVTERKTTDKALRKALEKAETGDRLLTALMENVPEGISISNPEGTIFMISKHGQDLMGGMYAGITIEEAVRGWTVYRLDRTTIMPMNELPLVRALNGEIVQDMEIVELNSEGQKMSLLCNAAPIRNAEGKVVDGILVWRDITAIKKAEQTLRENQWILEEAQRISHVGSWIWNIETSELFCSAETFRIYGEEPFSFQPTIPIYFSYVHPEDREYLKGALADLQAGRKQRLDLEFRILRKNHSVRYIHSIGEVKEFTYNGKPHIVRGIGQDITDRIKAEQELRESEARFRLLADSLPQLVWMLNSDGNTEYINQRFYDYTGASTEESSREKWAQLIHPDDVQRTLDYWHHCSLTGEPYTIEYRIKRRLDSQYRWFLTRALPVRDKNGIILHWFGTATDVHEQKQLLEDLRVSEERFRTLADNISQFAWMADPKGWIFWYNKRWYDYTGTTLEEMLGWGWKKVQHPDHVERVVKHIQHSWDTGELWEDTFPIKGKDGEYRWFLSRAVPIRNDQGEIVRWFGTHTDITERLQTEMTLKYRTEELAAANRDLESFSYSVSHDLRNPLHAIGSFASILLEDYADRVDEDGQDYLRRMSGTVKKMQALIDDMLTLSRIGRQEMNIENVNISRLVQNYLHELKGMQPERKTEFVIQNDIIVKADPRLIHLALENLLRNAWKFTSRQDVTRIEFGTSKKGDQIVYFIKDNGVGFDEKFVKEIFEPFKRVHAEKEFSGTGVGLSIVQRVIERHDGKVWAEGNFGKGATFYFTL